MTGPFLPTGSQVQIRFFSMALVMFDASKSITAKLTCRACIANPLLFYVVKNWTIDCRSFLHQYARADLWIGRFDGAWLVNTEGPQESSSKRLE